MSHASDNSESVPPDPVDPASSPGLDGGDGADVADRGDAEPSDHATDASTPAELETRLAEALEIADRDGVDALEQHLGDPERLPPDLREALAGLRSVDLLTQQAPVAPVAPTVLGDFRIKHELGAGGMGVVYLAEQSSLGREVALKVVRPELLVFEGARERFRREIDAVARLEHPAIVPILATGNADGVPFYAMPRLRGCSGEVVIKQCSDRDPATLTGDDLRAVLGGQEDDTASNVEHTFLGPWWQAVVRLVRFAALGIEHAHTRGILHRDLKPSNVMLSSDGRAVVLDFGLAEVREHPELTRSGTAAGSPAYMAPEQVRGEPSDERTDVYGLGALLASLLALRPPFVAKNAELLRQEILAGSRQELPDRAGIPPELAIVVDCALDVERARRYSSARLFADDLQAVLDGTPITARRLPVSVRARRFLQRHRPLAVGLGVAAAFLVLLPVLLLWQQKVATARLAEEVERTDTANAELVDQIGRSDRSVQISIDAVESLLSRVAQKRLRNSPATQEVALQILHDAIGLFDQLVLDEKFARRAELLRLRAWSQIAELQSSLGQDAAARESGQLILDLGRAFLRVGRDPFVAFLCGQSLAAQASHAVDDGKLDVARSRIAEARATFEGLLEEPSGWRISAAKEIALLGTQESMVHQAEDDPQAAEGALRRGIDGLTQLLESGGLGPERAVLKFLMQLNLAQQLRRRGRFDEATVIAEDVIATASRMPPEEIGWPTPSVMYAKALEERFLCRYYEKDRAGAVELSTGVKDAYDRLLRIYPDAAQLRRRRGAVSGNLALVLIGLDRLAEAEIELRAAIHHLQLRLEKSPTDARAHRFLVSQYKSLCWLLRRTVQWSAVEVAAREFGALELDAETRLRVARELLRCLPHVTAERAPGVLDLAMEYTLAAQAAGAQFDPESRTYTLLKEHERWSELSR